MPHSDRKETTDRLQTRETMLARLESETYHEGWQAHAAGWPLHERHTEPYRRGWLAREKIVGR